jgi:5-methylcytosine-specific restriction endonuclease McrA
VHQAQVDQQSANRRATVKRITGQYSGDYKRRAKAVRQSAVNCHICGDPARINDPWTADHIIAGDRNSPLAPAHRSCNERRGNKPLT